MAEKYILELSREQAIMVKQACEMFARLKIGQFERITEMLLDVQNAKDYCERRDLANGLLKAVACIIFGSNKYGTLDVKKDRYHHRAWNIYAAIRYKMAWHDEPKGGWAVCFDEPYPYGGEPVPKCTIVEREE